MKTLLRNRNDVFQNVQDGEYTLHKYGGGISSVTVTALDDPDALAGTLTFRSGGNTEVLDLATERWLGLAGCVTTLDMTVSGVPADANYQIALL